MINKWAIIRLKFFFLYEVVLKNEVTLFDGNLIRTRITGTNLSVWIRSRFFLHGAGAAPIWPEPKSASRLRSSGAAQKIGGSGALVGFPRNQKVPKKYLWGSLQDTDITYITFVHTMAVVFSLGLAATRAFPWRKNGAEDWIRSHSYARQQW